MFRLTSNILHVYNNFETILKISYVVNKKTIKFFKFFYLYLPSAKKPNVYFLTS